MWDELLSRHPGLMIDNANWRHTGPDIECLRRSIGSLTRSETACLEQSYPVYDQAQTAGLSLYLPLHTSGAWKWQSYEARSAATAGSGVVIDPRGDGIPRDVERARRIVDEIKALRPLYLGDYYPLLPITLDEAAWCGWQFDRPDLGQGFALVFRRAKSPRDATVIHLHALETSARYDVTFVDAKKTAPLYGAELGRLTVEIGTAPGSALITYRRSDII